MPFAPATRLGTYEIVAPLGAGGMGEVYRARDLRLGRDIALKVLPEMLAGDADHLARFEREARTVAGLNHPNIVTLHSIEEADGVRFLTMELVDGQTLADLVTPGGLPLDRVLDIAIAIADALTAAHERRVVHRDLKPANVMMTREGRVKVLDFGLAKAAHGTTPADSQGPTIGAALSTTGLIVGTVPYMAPEQIRGEPVDARTDLFAFGVLLYELLTGRRPFSAPTAMALSAEILHATPAPLTSVRADLPPDAGRIVGQCLEKGPRERPQTALEVANALRRLRRGLEHGQRGAAPAAEVSIAVLPFSDMSAAKDQEYLCEGMAEEIMNALMRIDGIRVASRTSAFRAGRSGDDLAAISRVLSVGHVLEGSVRTAGARLRVTAQLTDVASGYQLWSERFDREAIDVFAIQDEIAAGVVDAVKTRLGPGSGTVHARPQAHDLEAYRCYLKGRHLRGVEDFGGAMSAFQEAVRLDPAHAPSWTGLAEITVLSAHMGMILPRAACTAARKALAIAKDLQGESAEGLHVEAFASFLERRWGAMEAAWRRSIELEPDYVLALSSFGITLCARQRLDEALPLFQRAREADPLASFPYTLAGWGLVMSGRPEEALRQVEDALSFQKEDASAIAALAIANVALRNFKEAVEAGERGVAVTRRAPFFLGVLGWALAAAGRESEARAILEELRARPAGSPTVVSEAWLLGALGQIDGAFAVVARAEEECQGLLCYTGLPGFDTLRSDPRFAALMSRLELSPGSAPRLDHAGPESPGSLPKPRTPFIGRERELSECSRLLATSPLVTVMGVGGTGKTRFAIALAGAQGVPGGAWFVDLAAVSDPEQVLTTVAETLRTQEEAGRELIDLIGETLRARPALLVLDNCEHLLGTCAGLAEALLRRASSLRILATSREALGVEGERVYDLRPLALPEAGRSDLASAESAAAVRLFVDRARGAQPDFALTPANVSAVVEICRRLDGIPLALELAAARVKVLSVDQIRARLDDRFRLLTGGHRAALPRQQTLLAAIQWSDEQLSPDEQRMFHALSVFAGGWTLAAAGRVAGDGRDDMGIIDLLTSLVNKSLVLVDRDGDEPRYRMLETVRQYAYERLRESGMTEVTRSRHAETFLALAETAYRERSERGDTWCAVLEADHDNLSAALDSFRQSDAERYLEMVGALAWFWHARSHFREGRAHVTSALERSSPGPPRSARARAMWGAALMLAWHGDAPAARQWMQDSLEMVRTLGDEQAVADALNGVGWAQFANGEDEAGYATFEECLRLQTSIGDPYRINRARVGLAQLAVALNRTAEAAPLARQVIAFAQPHGDRRQEHFGWHFLADCALIDGRYEESLELYRKSLLLAQVIEDPLEISFEVQGIAMSAAGLGRHELAIRLAGAVDAEWERIGVAPKARFWDALLDRYLGDARRALGTEAERIAREGRELPIARAVAMAMDSASGAPAPARARASPRHA